MHNNKAKLLHEQALPSWIQMWTDVKNCVIRTIYDMCSRRLPGCHPGRKWNSVILRVVIGVEFIFSINRPNQASCFLLSFQAPLILVKRTISFSNSWLVCHFFLPFYSRFKEFWNTGNQSGTWHQMDLIVQLTPSFCLAERNKSHCWKTQGTR